MSVTTSRCDETRHPTPPLHPTLLISDESLMVCGRAYRYDKGSQRNGSQIVEIWAGLDPG